MRLSIILLGLAVLTSNTHAGAPSPVPGDSPIGWKVEASFGPFGWLPDPAAAMQAWTPDQDATLSSWLKGAMQRTNSASPYAAFIDGSARSPWNDKGGHYEQDYAQPTHTVIRAWLNDAGKDAQCRWRVGAQSRYSQPVPCAEPFRIVDVPLETASTIDVLKEGAATPVSRTITVRHKTIVALGDSYASGEGNPDVPTAWIPRDVRKDGLNWISSGVKSEARWWNVECHRSFWSHQTLAALKLAAASPDTLVTYLHYACSGAEILDGLLVRQEEQAGADPNCIYRRRPTEESVFLDEKTLACSARLSQLTAAVKDLCDGHAIPYSGKNPQEVKLQAQVHKQKYRTEVLRRHGLDIAICAGEFRKPDLVLVNISGNDIGFAQLVAWAVAPSKYRLDVIQGLAKKGKVVCPEKAKAGGCGDPYDVHLLRQLDQRLTYMAQALAVGLMGKDAESLEPGEARRFVLSSYPDPLIMSNKQYCGDDGGYNPHGPWMALTLRAPGLVKGSAAGSWEVNVLQDEARIVSENPVKELNAKIRSFASAARWTLADMNGVFTDRGWCNPAETDPPLSLPSHASEQDASAWRCDGITAANPACWRPYAYARRFVRTGNDAALTQTDSRNGGYFGTMHPNVHGHASLADVVHAAAADVFLAR